jgi:autotransporter-associated beta strand protein
MPVAKFEAFLRRLFVRRPSSPVRAKFRPRLGVECLESRLTPTTNTWLGAVNSGTALAPAYDWSSPGNWSLGTPVAGQDLVFGAITGGSAPQYTVTDDMALTSVNSITFTANTGYVIKPSAPGNTIDLSSIALSAPSSSQATVTANLTITAGGTPTPSSNAPLTITSTAGTTLAISSPTVNNGGNTLVVAGQGTVSFNGTSGIVPGVISGAGGLTISQKYSASGYTCNLDDAANYSGPTTITTGSVLLDAPSGYAVSNSLVIGKQSATFPSTAPAISATVTLGASNEIPGTGTSSVAIFPNGALYTGNLQQTTTNARNKTITTNQGYSDTIGSLLMQGGLIDTSDSGVAGATPGVITLGGDVTTLAYSFSAVIKGHLDLGSVTPDANGQQVRRFDLDCGTAVPDLDILATVSGGPNVGLELQGYSTPSNASLASLVSSYQNTGTPGMLELDGTNTYSGTTQVGAAPGTSTPGGTLIITTAQALGSLTTTAGTSNGATVEPGASLNLWNPVADTTLTFLPYSLTLNGAGDADLVGDTNLTGDVSLTDPAQALLDNGGALQAGGPTDGIHYTTLQWTGNVSLASNSVIEENDFTTLTIAPSATYPGGGIVSGPGGLIKTGTGIVVLGQNNSYTGATEVADGILKVNHAYSLGGAGAGSSTSPDTSAGTMVDFSGSLQLAGGVSIGNETLTLVAGAGGRYDFYGNATTDPTQATQATTALFSNGSSTWNGMVILAPNLLSGQTTNHIPVTDGATLTLAGVVADPTPAAIPSTDNFLIGQSDASLPHIATVYDGTVLLTGTNTYADTTEVRYGILAIASADALGSPANETINPALDGGTTVDTGATLQLRGGATGSIAFDPAENLTLNGNGMASAAAGAPGYGALQNWTGFDTWGGNVYLATSASISAAAYTYFLQPGTSVLIASTLTISGVISDPDSMNPKLPPSNLTELDSGVLELAGTNVYAGVTTVAAGTLVAENAAALGSTVGGTVVANGATLELSTLPNCTGLAYSPEPLTLQGGSNLLNAQGSNTWQGPITLANAASIPCSIWTDSNSVLNVSNVISDLSKGVTTGGALQTWAYGSLTFSYNGSEAYTGLTTVEAGTLTLASSGSNNVALIDSITVEPGAILAGTGSISGTVTTCAASQVYGPGTMSGTFAIRGNVNNAGTMSGSALITGNLTNSGIIIVGTPTLPGTVTVNGNYHQTSTGCMTIELAGSASYSEFSVTGTATLDTGSDLKIVSVDGFVPTPGNSFSNVLAFGSVAGSFTLESSVPLTLTSYQPSPGQTDYTINV